MWTAKKLRRSSRGKKGGSKAASKAAEPELEAEELEQDETPEEELETRSTSATASGSGKQNGGIIDISDSDGESAPVKAKQKAPLAMMHVDGPPVASSSKTVIDIDADYALALQLQEDFQNEADLMEVEVVTPPARDKGKGKAVEAEKASDDPKTVLEEFRTVLQGTGKCSKCRTGRVRNTAAPLDISDAKLGKSLFALAHTSCSSCNARLCAGCLDEADCSKSCTGNQKGCATSNCCSNVRFILLFHLLAALDRAYCAEHLKKPSTSPSKVAKKAPKAKAKHGAGTGYGQGHTHDAYYGMGMYGAAAMGYGGYDDEDDFDEENDDFYDEEGNYNAQYFAALAARAMAKGKGPAKKPAMPSSPKKSKGELQKDKHLTAALRLVEQLLPNPDKPDAQAADFLPHTGLAPLLLVSTLTEILADLLRNDSIAEAVSRADLYWTCLALLSALSASQATLDVLTKERPEKAWSEGIGAWIRGEGQVEWERVADPDAPVVGGSKKRKQRAVETPPPTREIAKTGALFSLLEKLLKQSKTFLKIERAQQNHDEAAVQAISLADSLISAGEAVERAVANMARATGGADIAISKADLQQATSAPPVSKGKSKAKEPEKAKAPAPAVNADAAYIKACEDLAFDALEDGVAYGHIYSKQKAVSWAPANAKYLNKEIVSLSTSLPAGIFVRSDETRRDLLRALIAGPADTPYAMGLYEFDIYLPQTYPDTPPQFQVKTTASGRWRSNPNLYAEGKVCLSLLGTWAGRPEEMWQPRSSTLQQVLVSIQSMILVDNPVQNEPGWNFAKTSHQAISYNKEVQLQNSRWAILDWMTEKGRTSIWKDVIQMHCRIRADEIRQDMRNWAAADHRLRAYSEDSMHSHGGAPWQAHRGARPAQTPAIDLINEFEQRLKTVLAWT